MRKTSSRTIGCKRPRRTLHLDPQNGLSGVLVRQLFAERTNRIGQIVHLGHRGPQSLHRVAALGDRLRRLIDGARKDLLRFGRTIPEKVERGLKPKQQPVEALQQGVVQVVLRNRHPRQLVPIDSLRATPCGTREHFLDHRGDEQRQSVGPLDAKRGNEDLVAAQEDEPERRRAT